MQYSPNELKLYRILEKATLPYILMPMILIAFWSIFGLLFIFIDIIFDTNIVLFINTIYFTYIGPIYILIFGFFYTLLIILVIFTSKYFGKLFSEQEFDLRISINNIENIATIIMKMGKIEKTIKKILFLRKILFWITMKRTFLEINDYFKTEISIFISSIIDLRSDLSIRLTEQQSTLESAKSEVEKNIVGTTKLNQVSELQRARLDRQIEQFEELQRVLVKI